MATVSVIIPSYNGVTRGYIRECLASVQAQTLAPVETIVVDDGSRDETVAWVREHFPDVKILRKQNGGLSNARNFGVAAATGDLIAFLDDDDAWEPQKLERQVAYLAAHPEVGMIYCGMRLVGPQGQELRTQVPTGLGLTWPAVLLSNHIFTPSTVVVRRSIAEAVGGFDASIALCEDYDYYIRCAKLTRIAGISDTLVRYRCHPQQMSNNLRTLDEATLRIIGRHASDLAVGGRIIGFVRAGAILRAAARRDFATMRYFWSGLPLTQLWLLGMRSLGLAAMAARPTRSFWRRIETRIVLSGSRARSQSRECDRAAPSVHGVRKLKPYASSPER